MRRLGVVLPLPMLLGVVLGAGCSSSSTSATTTGPSLTRCALSATASSSSFPPAGGTGSLVITGARECPWAVGSDTAWIVPEQTSGQGEATLTFRVTPNGTPNSRRGALTVESARIELAQEGLPCRFDVAPSQVTVPASGGPAEIGVTAMNGCRWTARALDSWIAIASGSDVDGTSTVRLSVSTNAGPARQGSVAVANHTIILAQAAAAPAPPGGGGGGGPSPPGGGGGGGGGTPPPPPSGTRVELDGRVTALAGECPALTFAVSGTRTFTTQGTQYKGGNCKHVEAGHRVIVVGERQSDGRVNAASVDLKP